MALIEQIKIFSQVKTDEDEYKEELLSNFKSKKQVPKKLDFILNPPKAEDLLKEVGVKCL